MEYIVVLVTAPNEEVSASIGGALVGDGLAACANVIRGVRSIYKWKGSICDDPECLIVVKTVSDNFEAIERRVRELHPYEVPEVISLPIVKGSTPYLDWVEESTRLG